MIAVNDPRRRAEIAQIQIARKELGWEDAFYRSVIAEECAGKTSSADLTSAERKKLLARMVLCGFKPKAGRRAGAGRALAQDGQSKMLRGLWLELNEREYVKDRSEAALAAWVKRETGIDALQWLSGGHPFPRNHAQRAIEQLKKWRDRDARKIQPLLTMLANQGRVESDNLHAVVLARFGSKVLTQSIAVALMAQLKDLAS